MQFLVASLNQQFVFRHKIGMLHIVVLPFDLVLIPRCYGNHYKRATNSSLSSINVYCFTHPIKRWLRQLRKSFSGCEMQALINVT